MSLKSHPITVQNFTAPYPFDLYTPAGRGPFPVVFQTPILGRFSLLEDLFFERRFARFFASQGLACVLIHRPIFEFEPQKGLEQIQAYIENSLKRNQSILKYVLQSPLLDTALMGTFGMSFGGIINCLWAAQELNFKANVFALTGGNLPEVFMRSRDPLMRSYQKAALEAVNYDANDLKTRLNTILKSEPLSAAASLSPETTLLILGLFDRVVPFYFGNLLRKSLRYPKTIFLPLGHYFSILSVPIIKWNVVSFFKKRFAAALALKKSEISSHF